MKKLIAVLLLVTLFISNVSCSNTKYKDEVVTGNAVVESDSSIKTTQDLLEKNDYSDKQNDLIYYDYDTGIELTTNSCLKIPNLNLELQDETATIYGIDVINNEMFRITDYKPEQVITYTPITDSIYIIIAELSNGELIDITPMAIIETNTSEELSGGIILLD